MTRSDLALEYFASGFNCAQSVLVAFRERLNLPETSLLQAASGFGAGMGRLQEQCGALTGAYICLGLAIEGAGSSSEKQREAVYQAVRDLSRSFQAKMGASRCRELLNCDISTEAGRQLYSERQSYEKVCQPCIKTAVHITEAILDTAEKSLRR